MSELEIREVEIREVDTEERTISGLAVPYNTVTTVSGYKERIERGAFAEVSDNVQLFYGHDHRTGGLPIGRVVEARESEDGLEIKAKFSDTPKANEVRTLVQDGVLNKFSVGFMPTASRKENGVIVRTKGDLKEVSIVAIPAYATASVSEVRDDSKNTKESINMSENELTSEVVELREQVSDLERKFSVLSVQGQTETTGSQYRSGGEWLKALAAGEESAKVEVRAFTGATFADNDDATRPAWINQALKLVEEKRTITQLFGRAALPATGLSYVYPQVTSVAGTVGKQATEGADLPYLEVVVGQGTGVINTYGGYTSLSRQVIERSEVGFLELSLRHLFNQYGVATEKAVRDVLVGATGTQAGTLTAAHGAATAKQWITTVFDAAALIEDNSKGAQAEMVLVSRDVFRSLATLVDGAGRPMFVLNGDGVNSIGNVNLRGVAGNIAGYPVVVGGGLPAGTMLVTSREALTVREDATKSLQDENIINLTKDFSVYGYLAVDLSNPLAIVKVDTDGVA